MIKFRKLSSVFQFRLQTLFFVVIIFAILGAWWNDHREMSQVIYELQRQGPRWDTDQVTGPPDTPGSGDLPTAWASATQDAMREWLVVEYAQPAVPRLIEIYETYNPGAVDRVSVFRDNGAEVTVWTGTDPTPASSLSGTSKIPVNIDFPVTRVKIHINSPAVAGWNEIDAIGMVDNSGKRQWAEKAYASSSFGRNRTLPRWYE